MISYAQNLEDVVLNRVFQNKPGGFYIDVGAHDPVELSVTKHFHDLGWTGINIEPLPAGFEKFQVERPNDINLNLAVGSRHDFGTLYELEGYPELSTMNGQDAESLAASLGVGIKPRAVEIRTLAEICRQYCNSFVDFIKIDVEGFERQVIEGADWTRFRPTLVVIEAVRPMMAVVTDWDHADQAAAWQEWEPLLTHAGYSPVYFDGLNRYYLRQEDLHLSNRYSTPISVIQDHFSLYQDHKTLHLLQQQMEVGQKERRSLLDRLDALQEDRRRMSEEASQQRSELSEQIEALRQSLAGQESRIRALTDEREQFLAKIQHLEDRHRRMSEEASQQRSELSEQIEALRQSLAGQESRIRALTDERAQLLARIQHLVRQYRRVSEEASQQRSELDDQRARLQAARAEFAHRDRDLREICTRAIDTCRHLCTLLPQPLHQLHQQFKSWRILATVLQEPESRRWIRGNDAAVHRRTLLGARLAADLAALEAPMSSLADQVRAGGEITEFLHGSLRELTGLPCAEQAQEQDGAGLTQVRSDSPRPQAATFRSTGCNILWDHGTADRQSLSVAANPLVTVITVVLNAAPLVEQTIRSILSQSYQPIEYLIIDGGSTDGTIEVVKRFQDRVGLLLSEPDNGIYDAMNKGIDLAHGRWTIFLNAGDRFHDAETLTTVMAHVRDHHDLVYGDTYLLKQDGSLLLEKCWKMEDMWKYNPFYHQSVLCKTDLLKQHKFSTHYKIVADAEFIYKQYLAGRQFLRLEVPVSICLDGGLSKREEILLWIERWKMALDLREKPEAEIHRFYHEIISKKLAPSSKNEPPQRMTAPAAIHLPSVPPANPAGPATIDSPEGSPPPIKWMRLNSMDLDHYGERPIFIVGSPRSGTTLMRSIIDAHPAIFCPPLETFLFTSMRPTFLGHIWDYQFSNSLFRRSDYLQWLRDFVLSLFANHGMLCGKRRFAEKTPSHVHVMDLIREAFPDAQFIHMIRNGYEVCRSIKEMPWGHKDIGRSADQWLKSIEVARKFGAELGPLNYIEIRMEDLLADPEGRLRGLCTFLDEPFHPVLLEFHQPENNSWGLQLSPLAASSGSHRGDLSPAEKELFCELAGTLMTQLGYDLPNRREANSDPHHSELSDCTDTTP